MKKNPENKIKAEAEAELAKLPDNVLYDCLLNYGSDAQYGIQLKRILTLSGVAQIPPRILNYQNPEDQLGLTPLMMVIRRPQTFHNKNLLADLLKAGADINKKNTDGFNALLYAVSISNVAAVNLLLQQHEKIDFSIKDHYGRNALMLAFSGPNYNRELALILLNTSINTDARNADGKTAAELFEECTEGHTLPADLEISKVLSQYPAHRQIYYSSQDQTDRKHTKEAPKPLLHQVDNKQTQNKIAKPLPPQEEDTKEKSSKKSPPKKG